MKRSIPWLSLALLAMLAGCSTEESPPAAEAVIVGEDTNNLTLRGTLTYRSHIAMQPESQAVVELVEAQGEGPGERVLSEQRIGLVGREVPIRFVLEVPHKAIKEGLAYQLRAYIEESGKVSWQTDPVALGELGESLVLEELVLLPARSAGFSSILHCGQLQISAGYEGNDLVLQVRDQRYRMLPVRGASGARFEAEGDASTRFSSKGDTALLTLKGQSFPECVPPGVLPKPFVARGNEPAWELRLEAQRLSLRRNEDLLVDGAPYELATEDSEGQSYLLEEHPDMKIQVQRQVCQDSMTGIPYPFDVQVNTGSETLRGCGGEPARLLQGVDWVFESIGGQTPVDGSSVSLTFHPNDRFAGRASCNNLAGEYGLTGESLTLSRAVTTRKACAPALMEQEQRFLEALERVHSFTIDKDGSLLLLTPQADVLKARRT